MEETMVLTILSAVFALVGCPGKTCDSGDSGSCGETGGSSDTDTDTDADTDADFSATVTWSADGVAVGLTNGSGTYSFGMAETGSANGWYGEDCIDGAGPNSGDYDICHDSMPAGGYSLASVHDPDAVVANETTLLLDSMADGITYLIYSNATGDCWTSGNDTSYYGDFGCTDM
jgi:hypothetical protein